MDIELLLQATMSIGFPALACIFMGKFVKEYIQSIQSFMNSQIDAMNKTNDKMQETLSEISSTLILMNDRIKDLEEGIQKGAN